MKIITIDLELEQPNDGVQITDSLTNYPAILQVGLCCYDLETHQPIETKTIHIRYPHPISSYIRKLTGINNKDCNESDITEDDAMVELKAMRERHNADRKIYQWGGGDLQELANESHMDDLSWWGFGRTGVNVKHLFQAYCLANGINSSGGLSKSMGKLGLQFQTLKEDGRCRGKHWAATDALNTAIIFDELLKRMKQPLMMAKQKGPDQDYEGIPNTMDRMIELEEILWTDRLIPKCSSESKIIITSTPKG
jgi:hypothetical protein